MNEGTSRLKTLRQFEGDPLDRELPAHFCTRRAHRILMDRPPVVNLYQEGIVANLGPAMILPAQLVLRCYVRRSGLTKGRWVAHCLDLDLWTVGDSLSVARDNLREAINGYVEVVLNTDDEDSIQSLLTEQKAPFRFFLFWHAVRLLNKIQRNGWPLDSILFKYHLPLRPITA